VYFTSLLEYQLKKEAARPLLTLRFYTEFIDDKDLVLMVGSLDPENKLLELKDAQHLVYQLQLFYITGTEKQKSMVEVFTTSPDKFDYREQIQCLQDLQ
jgi:ATP synthase F1 complex assembly factor 1